MLQEKPHQELEAWKEAMNLGESIYRVANIDPETRYSDLAEKIRSVALAIALKIEAYVYDDGTFDNTLNDVISECQVLDTCLILGQRIGLLSEGDFETLMNKLNAVENLILKKIKENQEKWEKYISTFIEGEEENMYTSRLIDGEEE
ncbi:four helix bundle protein [Myroides marinus]|uniref:four helix bundle protein n=1 Tax=Myroides marinus TaxID=703342 RepID=UPI002575A454|nr:four helix bundle protein [Myroides marinus]MDM1376506.1 four helix bundle protein [Myroides marinus]